MRQWKEAACILYCHYRLFTSSSLGWGLGSYVRDCVKLIKEFLYSNPYIGSQPSLTSVFGEARCKTRRKQDLSATVLLPNRDQFLPYVWNYYQNPKVHIPQQKCIFSKYKWVLLDLINSSRSSIRSLSWYVSKNPVHSCWSLMRVSVPLHWPFFVQHFLCYPAPALIRPLICCFQIFQIHIWVKHFCYCFLLSVCKFPVLQLQGMVFCLATV